jgi:D-arabinitol 4-dehydrogenase
VIAFTVTESGYYLTPEHELDSQQADIKTDINGGICTLYGALTRILKERMEVHGEPVTLLSCDNLRHNGERFRHGFSSFLKTKGEIALHDWVKNNTTSPNTMVDRITPRPTPDVAERVLAATVRKTLYQ